MRHNIFVRGYLLLCRKDAIPHMLDLVANVRKRLLFARDSSFEESVDLYLCFRLVLLDTVSWFFFLCESPSLSFSRVFLCIFTNINSIFLSTPLDFSDFDLGHSTISSCYKI